MRGASVLPTPPNQSQTCSVPALQEMASNERGQVLGPCSPPQPPSCDPPRLQEEPHIPVDRHFDPSRTFVNRKIHKMLRSWASKTTTDSG